MSADRLAPDREEKHGLHRDYWWPGRVESVWDLSEHGEIKRIREYHDANHQRLKKTTWLVRLKIRNRWLGFKTQR